ncbi:Nucleoredoxin 1-2 like [Actinidia chinensis var. chinensis]|uniref:Nucleoredoxin 1-2 like n=1 Tax=Actinidia chinensis var. chinensis TaxID=1590841 RepID=A0A2R6QKV7_ACTCC|nr:Nucleoredoxin 1-2 like [Actinidia chinensis var. chinensis]
MERRVKHFSHPHLLQPSQVAESEEIHCSGCEQPLSGQAYSCTKPNCDYFFLHESCFNLPRQLCHRSHPHHPLSLLPFPAYPSGSFSCNACDQVGRAFVFHCATCQFDLHVKCAQEDRPSTTAVEVGAGVGDQWSTLAAQQRRLQAARFQAEIIRDSSRAIADLAGSETPYYTTYVRRYY